MEAIISRTQTSNNNKYILTADWKDYLIELGYFYSIENIQPLASEGTSYIVFDPATNWGKSKLKSFPTYWHTTVGRAVVTLGVVDSYSGGTELTPTNRSWNYNGSDTVVVKGATVVNFQASDTVIGVGGVSTNQAGSGDTKQGGREIDLDPSLIYAFRIVNAETDAQDIDFAFDWIEIPTGAF